MTSKTFITGTVIDAAWLNDVNTSVYTTVPALASPTSINNNNFSHPASAATWTAGSGKTITISNTLTFTGTDGSTLNIGAGGTLGSGAFATVTGTNTGDQNLAPYALLAGGNTFTGLQTVPAIRNAVVALGNVTGAKNIDLSLAGTYTATITGVANFTFTNAPAANFDQTVYLKVTNGGAFATTFPAGTKYPGGAAPTFTVAGKDLLAIWYDVEQTCYVVGMIWKDYK